MPTGTADPDNATPSAIRIGKINLNRVQSTDNLTRTPRILAEPDSDFTPVARSGESDIDSEYVELLKKFPTRSYNMP